MEGVVLYVLVVLLFIILIPAIIYGAYVGMDLTTRIKTLEEANAATQKKINIMIHKKKTDKSKSSAPAAASTTAPAAASTTAPAAATTAAPAAATTTAPAAATTAATTSTTAPAAATTAAPATVTTTAPAAAPAATTTAAADISIVRPPVVESFGRKVPYFWL